ncbi:MAG: class I SAM-dependent methyltransferase [Neobacillus sp.]
MFVTTAGRTNEQMIKKAYETAKILGVEYIPRQKKSIHSIQLAFHSDCLVVGKERLELFLIGSEEPFFFHPNSAMFRIKRLLNGEHDPFADAVNLSEGMSFLDCTLGLAADSIVASYLVGKEGKVIGIEAQKYISYLVTEGLKTWDSGLESMNAAMARVHVINDNAQDYLKHLPDESFDCVYFDPMFGEPIIESNGISTLSNLAMHESLNNEMINEALRVARKRVVLKDHYKSENFYQYNFYVHRRKTAKFHYGILEK